MVFIFLFHCCLLCRCPASAMNRQALNSLKASTLVSIWQEFLRELGPLIAMEAVLRHHPSKFHYVKSCSLEIDYRDFPF